MFIIRENLFADVKRAVADRQVKIVMRPEKHKSVQRHPAQPPPQGGMTLCILSLVPIAIL